MNLSVSDIFTIVPVIFVSMAFHEATHAFTSHWLGDSTAKDMGRLTINPLKHIDPFMTLVLPVVTLIFFGVPLLAAKPVPFNPDRVKFDEFGAAMIGVAGPISNFVLAAFGAIILRFMNMPTEIFNVLMIFVQINVALFVFNMIPFPPLDGSRLLYAVAPEFLQNIMYRIEQLGMMAIFLFFIVLGPAFGPLLVFLNGNILRLLLGPMYQF